MEIAEAGGDATCATAGFEADFFAVDFLAAAVFVAAAPLFLQGWEGSTWVGWEGAG